jgi:hypothetical protein
MSLFPADYLPETVGMIYSLIGGSDKPVESGDKDA